MKKGVHYNIALAITYHAMQPLSTAQPTNCEQLEITTTHDAMPSEVDSEILALSPIKRKCSDKNAANHPTQLNQPTNHQR